MRARGIGMRYGFTAVLILALAGCGKSKTGEDGVEGNEDAIEDTGPTDAASHTIPASLSAMEAGAEDGYDKALAADFPGAVDAAAAVRKGWTTYRPLAVADKADAAWLTGMDAAVQGFETSAAAGVDKVAIGRAANAVSAWMDRFFGLYSDPVPVQVIRLDYLGREVVLDAMVPDFTAAEQHRGDIASTWAQVRPTVVSAGGTQQASDTDASLGRLATAIQAKNGATTIQEANAFLDLVDGLEGVFAK